MEMVALTYKLAVELPKQDQFVLWSQVTRAAVSIPSNIAEGSAKNSKKEYVLFLEYSLGSAYELETQVLIVDMLDYGDRSLRMQLLAGIDEEQKMLQSFILAVKKG